MPTQCEQVLQHLRSGKTITTREAFTDFGITRLAARIHELRQEGHPIADETVKVKNRNGKEVEVSSYYLPQAQPRTFGDLAIGARFRLKEGGRIWHKESAFSAVRLEAGPGGGNRMIDQATEVYPASDRQ